MRSASVSRAASGSARQNAFGSLMILGSQRVSRLVVLVATAALLTTDSFATLALVLALTDLVRGTLQAFDVGGARLLAGGRPDATVLQTSLDAKTVSGLAGMLFITLLAFPVGSPEAALLTALSGVGVFAASYGSSFLVERQAVLALHSVGRAVLISNALGAVCGIALAWLTEAAVGAVIGLVLGDVLLLVSVSRGHRWQQPDLAAATELLRSSRELLTMQLAYIGQFRVGTIILSAFGSALAVAEYSIASRVMEGLVVIAAALTASSLPLMAAAHAREERARLAGLFDRSYRLGLIIVASLAASLVVAAPVWIWALFPQYPDVGTPSAIVGLAVMIFFGSSQTTALLNATHHDRAANRSAVTGLAISALATFFLVPFGSLGVAWARVAGELARFVVEASAGIRYVGIRLLQLARPWLVTSPALVGASVAVLEQWRTPYVWIAASLVLVAAMASSRLVASGVGATPTAARMPD